MSKNYYVSDPAKAKCLHDYPELPGCICCSSPDCDLDPDREYPPCDHETRIIEVK